MLPDPLCQPAGIAPLRKPARRIQGQRQMGSSARGQLPLRAARRPRRPSSASPGRAGHARYRACCDPARPARGRGNLQSGRLVDIGSLAMAHTCRLRSRRRTNRTFGEGRTLAVTGNASRTRAICKRHPASSTVTGRPPLALRARPAASPTVLFLTGFRSDMTGAKALHLERHCAQRAGLPALRLSRPWCVGRPVRGRLHRRLVRRRPDDAGRGRYRVRSSWSAPAWAAGSCCSWRWRGRSACAGSSGLASAPDFTQDLIEARADGRAPGHARARRRAPAPFDYGEPTADHRPPAGGRRAPLAARQAHCRFTAQSICCTASRTPTCPGRPRCAWPLAWRARP